MPTRSLPKVVRAYPVLCLTVLCLALGSSALLYAHDPGGSTLSAPTEGPTPTINGTIDTAGSEAAWLPGVVPDNLPNNCAEFAGSPAPPPLTVYAFNDGVKLFLAFDIPDTTPNITDSLWLFFDTNHGGGTTPAADDRALRLTFNNLAASNSVPDAERFSGNGTIWVTGGGLPAEIEAKYTRHASSWQIELSFPKAGPTIPFPGATSGFAFVYLNEIGACPGGGDCDCDDDGQDDDYYARFPTTLSLTQIQQITLPGGIADPSLWGNLNFGPAPPTVSFTPPLCCHSADIAFLPAAQPFTAGTPVNIAANVHNLDASQTANNVNLEIRVHKFGTGGGIIFQAPTTVASIAPSGSQFSAFAQWPSPEPGLHGCIRAEIKPPTLSPYFISGGNSIAQHNIDVACIPMGERKAFQFQAFNPDPQHELKILLAKQVLLPAGLEGLRFDLQQPDRPLRPLEELPVFLTVTVADNVPPTQVPKQNVKVPPTSGGTAVPPLRQRSGTDPLIIAVRPGDRLHLSALGDVDLDGKGPLPSVGPDGKDFSNDLKDAERRFLLSGETAFRFAGALIGSFDAFKNSFLVGSELTLTVPDGTEKLWLAVNDLDGAYDDNTGNGFDVEASTLPPLQLPAKVTAAAQPQAAQVTLPQVNITAASSARVTAGRAVYNVLTNHGGVTYQFLVVDAKGHSVGGFFHSPFGVPWWLIYPLLLLLLLGLLIFAWLHRRKSRLQGGHV
jgi:hypothetical protein